MDEPRLPANFYALTPAEQRAWIEAVLTTLEGRVPADFDRLSLRQQALWVEATLQDRQDRTDRRGQDEEDLRKIDALISRHPGMAADEAREILKERHEID